MESSTQVLRRMLTERGVEWKTNETLTDCWTRWSVGKRRCTATEIDGFSVTVANITPEQAIAATLGKQKAKAHPYGYEPDTGAFDVTRCECGCLNDISATYCNDCGGEIEVDMNAEKEIYHTPRHMVFAEKHDDGSLEFCERRYVPEDAATLGKPMTDANLEQALSFMRIWISEDAHLGESELSAAFEKAEGLRKLDAIESAIAATLGGGDDSSRYAKLFGTPERAARTLEKGKTLCAWCDKQTCSTSGGECRIYDYDALLEWLRGESE